MNYAGQLDVCTANLVLLIDRANLERDQSPRGCNPRQDTLQQQSDTASASVLVLYANAGGV